LPRSKYAKVPGPLRPIEQITLSAFQFDTIARRELIGLLPLQFHQLGVPEDIKQAAAESGGGPRLKTLAEYIVSYTQELVQAYLTEVRLGDRTPTILRTLKPRYGRLEKRSSRLSGEGSTRKPRRLFPMFWIWISG
jgi:hypothetical protein